MNGIMAAALASGPVKVKQPAVPVFLARMQEDTSREIRPGACPQITLP